MDYRSFKQVPEQVSLLGFGAMRLPQNGEKSSDIDAATAQEMFDLAIEGGVNYFDTAYVYHDGASEAFVARALKGRERSSYYLATKMPMFFLKEQADLTRIFNEQLQRLHTDYIDFYLMHGLDAGSFEKAESLELYEFMLEQKRAGRIRHLGFSFHDAPDVLERICAAHEWDFCQIQLNYFDWTRYQSREQYEILQKHDIPCIIMEPLRGGALADLGTKANAMLEAVAPGRSVASWALRYAASLPGVLTVLSGMSTPAQVRDNLAIMADFAPLTDDERRALDAALDAYEGTLKIPCTSCRYCVPCPQDIPIPGVFAEYNLNAKDDDMARFTFLYDQIMEAPAANCTACGSCAERCPQHLPIPQLMQQLDAKTLPGQLVL